jgi:hypothetical protein
LKQENLVLELLDFLLQAFVLVDFLIEAAFGLKDLLLEATVLILEEVAVRSLEEPWGVRVLWRLF